jgi:hypothetical protein
MSNGLMEFLTNSGSALPETTVYVEAWKRHVSLRGLTARERDLFEAENLNRSRAKAENGGSKRRPALDRLEPDLSNFRARLVSRHIVEDGVRTFANPRGEEILGEQPASVMDQLYNASQKLSGFSAEDVEVLQGNSDATDVGEPSSDSQEFSDVPLRN